MHNNEILIGSIVVGLLSSGFMSQVNSAEFPPIRLGWKKPELGELEADCLRLRNMSLQHMVPVRDLRELVLSIELRSLGKNIKLHADPAFRNLKTAIAVYESENATRDHIHTSERIFTPRNNIYGPFGLRVRPAVGTGDRACIDQLVFQFLSESLGL